MKKWVTNTLYGILIGTSCVAVGYGSYMIANKSINNNTFIPTVNDKFGKSAWDYWCDNSFKVWFQTSDDGKFSQGTAWSFYIDDTTDSDFVSWYLATNFHVVNEPLYYNGSWIGEDPVGLNYNHIVPVSGIFCLQNTTKKGYRSVFSSNLSKDLYFEDKDSQVMDKIGPGEVSSNVTVDIISDNSNRADNLDNLDLFSNSVESSLANSSYYNLDMAMFRIKMPRYNFNRNTNFFKNISNPYQYWLSQGRNNSLITFNRNNDTFIAGNPGKAHQLVANQIPKDTVVSQNRYESNNNGHNNNPYLSREWKLLNNLNCLHAKNMYTQRPMEKWELSAGSSGSAVYQKPFRVVGENETDNFIEAKTTIPVGIYWGGWPIPNKPPSFFTPGFTPFITDQYNIFENFGNALKKGFN